MFALSRDGEKVFLYQPGAGLDVPMLLDLERKKLTVQVPSVDELENDYAVYDELNEMVRTMSHVHSAQVRLAQKMSKECSRLYRGQLSTGKVTVSELRKLFEDYTRTVSMDRFKETRSELHAATPAQPASSFIED